MVVLHSGQLWSLVRADSNSVASETWALRKPAAIRVAPPLGKRQLIRLLLRSPPLCCVDPPSTTSACTLFPTCLPRLSDLAANLDTTSGYGLLLSLLPPGSPLRLPSSLLPSHDFKSWWIAELDLELTRNRRHLSAESHAA